MKIRSGIKKYVVLFGVHIILIGAGSCNEFLDEKPTDGLVRSEYWKNKEEVLATLSGAYKKLSDLDRIVFIHGEIRGDMVDAGNSLESAQEMIMSSNIRSNNRYADWGDFYSVINICNHVINLAPSVQEQDQTFTDYLLQQYVAEAVFLRSLSYFYLVRIFNDVPFVLEPSETDNSDFFPQLTASDEILSSIKADLIAIEDRIPVVYPSIEESVSRATKGAVNALLADISLWNYEYEDCISYVQTVEDLGIYFLLPSTKWFEIYQPGFSLEGIFEIYFNKALGQNNSLYSMTIIQNAYIVSEYTREVLSPEVFEAAEQIRGNGTYTEANKIWKYGGQLPDRMSTRPASTNTSANFIIYRLSDLFLMKAEALAFTGSFEESLYYINTIRERANMAPLTLSYDAQTFEDAILEERAKELAFEGKRWFDLLRMGRRDNFANKEKLIEIMVQDVPSTQKLVQRAKLSNPLGWFMPIHINEIERNRNITQNPYYYEDN